MSEQLPIRFDATRGCPQQTVLDIGGRRFTLTLLASAADVAALRSTGMFVASVDEDTYTVASQVQTLLVKTHAADTGKIELIKDLVWEHLLMDRFLEVAREATFD